MHDNPPAYPAYGNRSNNSACCTQVSLGSLLQLQQHGQPRDAHRPISKLILQYKHNTSILIRWIFTTAAPVHALPKPKNGNSKNKKSATKGSGVDANLSSPEVTLSELVSLSGVIAEAKEKVPSAILSLFDKVIQASLRGNVLTNSGKTILTRI